MIKLTKKFVVVYVGKDVVFLSQNNTETYGTEYEEFGSMQELEEFITEKELKVKDTE